MTRYNYLETTKNRPFSQRNLDINVGKEDLSTNFVQLSVYAVFDHRRGS